jgi:endonuclease/exonuclease/phosphatase family metal-dependent hydrolase
MRLRVLTWNLFHGRAMLGAAYGGRHAGSHFDAFAGALGAWRWDVALLQEVPPWWPTELAVSLGVQERHVLTSRNGLPAVRRWLAQRWPELMRSQGGGCNAILVRGGVAVTEERYLRLRLVPERRKLIAVRLEARNGNAAWIGNVHLSGRDRRAAREAVRAGEALLEWADGEPAALGGDFNLPYPSLPEFSFAGGHYVDHVLVARLAAATVVELPARDGLSDHPAVIVTVGQSARGVAAVADQLRVAHGGA